MLILYQLIYQSCRYTNLIACKCTKSKCQTYSIYIYIGSWTNLLARIVKSWAWVRFFSSKRFMSSNRLDSTQIFMNWIWANTDSLELDLSVVLLKRQVEKTRPFSLIFISSFLLYFILFYLIFSYFLSFFFICNFIF
jgi:hypothetical protein